MIRVHMKHTLYKSLLSLSKVILPSLIYADLTRLSPIQKLTLGIRHTLTMRILEKENTANQYLSKRNP